MRDLRLLCIPMLCAALLGPACDSSPERTDDIDLLLDGTQTEDAIATADAPSPADTTSSDGPADTADGGDDASDASDSSQSDAVADATLDTGGNDATDVDARDAADSDLSDADISDGDLTDPGDTSADVLDMDADTDTTDASDVDVTDMPDTDASIDATDLADGDMADLPDMDADTDATDATDGDMPDAMVCVGGCGLDEVCVAGQCVLQCTAPEVECAGICADLATSARHCGACGNPCGAGEVCVDATCLPGSAPPIANAADTCQLWAQYPPATRYQAPVRNADDTLWFADRAALRAFDPVSGEYVELRGTTASLLLAGSPGDGLRGLARSGEVERWDGTAWVSLGNPATFFDPDGGHLHPTDTVVWDDRHRVHRHDGNAWTEIFAFAGPGDIFAARADGDLTWVSYTDGVVAIDAGGSTTAVTLPRVADWIALELAADGTVWIGDRDGLATIDAATSAATAATTPTCTTQFEVQALRSGPGGGTGDLFMRARCDGLDTLWMLDGGTWTRLPDRPSPMCAGNPCPWDFRAAANGDTLVGGEGFVQVHERASGTWSALPTLAAPPADEVVSAGGVTAAIDSDRLALLVGDRWVETLTFPGEDLRAVWVAPDDASIFVASRATGTQMPTFCGSSADCEVGFGCVDTGIDECVRLFELWRWDGGAWTLLGRPVPTRIGFGSVNDPGHSTAFRGTAHDNVWIGIEEEVWHWDGSTLTPLARWEPGNTISDRVQRLTLADGSIPVIQHVDGETVEFVSGAWTVSSGLTNAQLNQVGTSVYALPFGSSTVQIRGALGWTAATFPEPPGIPGGVELAPLVGSGTGFGELAAGAWTVTPHELDAIDTLGDDDLATDGGTAWSTVVLDDGGRGIVGCVR